MRDQISQLRKTRMMALATGQKVPIDFRTVRASADEDRAHLYLYDVIDSDDWFGISASMIVEALLEAGGRDLTLHLNSPGGQVTEGLAIYNNIKNYSGDVEVRIEGAAFSAASFVALAGNRTVIEPSALMMLHDAWDITIGNAEAHSKAVTVLDSASDVMADIYAKKTGGTAEEWRTVLKAERWYKPEEALAAGLVDEVLTAEVAGAQAKWGSFAPAQNDSKIAAGALSGVDLDSLRQSLKGAFA